MKKLIAILLIVVLTAFAAACGEKNVAEVNGDAVTYDEFEFYWDNLSKIYDANGEILSDDMKQTVAEQLVYDTLLEQTVAEYDIFPTKEEEESYYLAEMELAYGSYEAAMELMEEYDLDEEFFRYQYRYRLYEDLIIEELAADGSADVSEEEAWELFEAAPELYNWREVSVLLVKPYPSEDRVLTADNDGNTIYTEEEWAAAKASCEMYLEELNNGGDFAEMARKYSDDSTAAGGGKIAERLYRDSEGYDTAFLDAAFSLNGTGEYTKTPVKTSLGYELIFCDAVLTPDRTDEVIAYIMETQTESNRRELLTSYIAEKESSSEIVYYNEVWE